VVSVSVVTGHVRNGPSGTSLIYPSIVIGEGTDRVHQKPDGENAKATTAMDVLWQSRAPDAPDCLTAVLP
jgi:hypothetical protein